MAIEIVTGPFDPWGRLAAAQAALAGRADSGACAVFVGTMRDFNEGDSVAGMTLEHYPGMTERALADIVAEATQRWPVNELLIVHRVGPIAPGDAIVLTAAWSAHREAAFAACRHLIEALKHRAPFWKKETLATGGARWVTRNTPASAE
ncbi:molybdenum cofactor biosynthesis protein MoaE [Immundisolibacter sp.]|uniref:molybdenum cofactor biosynthesis protein MoaE n=1 Tax=Immundisolibacter sp. TaxID=1934948 RepID=UPI00260CDB49|nr:molybdenum cofactor biosynthesis protein MoaE [Immundisolibacter sp.]MDD3650367.1 molybdenum cofactor biosynthesis protein MoaE [Immundisolibacter sp.]